MKHLPVEAGHKDDDWQSGELRTVAFVDILGFGTTVMKSESTPGALPRMVDALVGGLSNAGASDSPGVGFLEEFDPSRQQVFFSDCAIVSALVVPGAPDEVLQVVLSYACHLLKAGFVLRGGVARGLVVHRGSLVVGPAVVKAYLMERDAAHYPRIIVEDEIATELLAIEESPNDIATIRRSEDGVYFLDVLTTLGLRPDGADLLRDARQLILGQLAEGGPFSTQAKWRWLAAQYNRAVECVELVREGVDGLPEPIRQKEVADLA